MDQDWLKWRTCLEGVARLNAGMDACFASAKNDEERSKLVANARLNYYLCEMEKCPRESKNGLKSTEFRELGNEAFNSNPPKLRKALQFYSKSILYAPPGTNQLSLGYANRSAVLLKGGYYAECLMDIDRALENGYPDDLKPKLLIRKLTCSYALTGNTNFESDEILMEARSLIEKLPVTNKTRQLVEDTINNPGKITSIGRQVKNVPPKYVPEVKGNNPQLPGASDAIALKYTKENGKHIVATRDIKSGEVLATEEPYAAIVLGEKIHYICTHCTKRTVNSIPCDNCVHAMFCSEKCKQAAWSDYHDIECEVIGVVNAKNIELLSLRMTVKAIKEAGTLENLKKRLKELDSLEEFNVDIPIIPKSFETIYTMEDNYTLKNAGELVYYEYISTRIACYLAIKTEALGKKFPRDSNVLRESEEFSFVTDLIGRNMRIVKSRSSEGNGAKDNSVTQLVPIYSFLNHRCYEGVVLVPSDGKISIITPVPIKKGDQIFTCYRANYTGMSRQLRQEFYQAEYHFSCNCLACVENWTISTPISWKKQNLPPRIAKRLKDGIQTIKTFDFHTIQDRKMCTAIYTHICELMDLLHSSVKKPCLEVEFLSDILVYLYTTLSSPHYKFGEECQVGLDGVEYCYQCFFKKDLSSLLSCI